MIHSHELFQYFDNQSQCALHIFLFPKFPINSQSIHEAFVVLKGLQRLQEITSSSLTR